MRTRAPASAHWRVRNRNASLPLDFNPRFAARMRSAAKRSYGFDGLVSKPPGFGYTGRAKSSVKVKNPNSPAAMRIEDGHCKRH